MSGKLSSGASVSNIIEAFNWTLLYWTASVPIIRAMWRRRRVNWLLLGRTKFANNCGVKQRRSGLMLPTIAPHLHPGGHHTLVSLIEMAWHGISWKTFDHWKDGSIIVWFWQLQTYIDSRQTSTKYNYNSGEWGLKAPFQHNKIFLSLKNCWKFGFKVTSIFSFHFAKHC